MEVIVVVVATIVVIVVVVLEVEVEEVVVVVEVVLVKVVVKIAVVCTQYSVNNKRVAIYKRYHDKTIKFRQSTRDLLGFFQLA